MMMRVARPLALAVMVMLGAAAWSGTAWAQVHGGFTDPLTGAQLCNQSTQQGEDCRAADTHYQVNAFVVDCYECKMVGIFYELAQKMGSEFFKQVQAHRFVETFGGLFVAFWVMGNLAKLFSPFGVFTVGAEFWHAIWKVFAWYGVAVGVAEFGGFDFFWSWLVEPLASTFAGLGQSVMAMGGYSETCGQFGAQLPGAGVSDAERSLLCFVQQMHAVPGVGLVYAMVDITQVFNLGGFFSTPSAVVGGILLLLAFTALYVVFVLSFLEVVFRLVAPAVLFPLSLIAWIFPISRSFARSALGMLLHAFFYLLMMGIIFAVGVRFMALAIQSAPGGDKINAASIGTFGDFLSNNISVVQPLGLSDASLWIMISLAVLVAMLLRQASGIASALVQYSDGLSGTSGHGIGVALAAARLGGTAAGSALGPLGAAGMQALRGARELFGPRSGGGGG